MSQKNSNRLQGQSSAKYPSSFPNVNPTTFSPFPFFFVEFEFTKKSVAN